MTYRNQSPLPRTWREAVAILLLAIAGGFVTWLVVVLVFSFGDEGRCITAAYRIDHQAACPEVQP